MQSRQPPSRLPPQESDIRRFENPLSEQPLHFNPLVLQSGLTPPPLSVEQPWRGKPLVSYQAIVQLIAATTTRTGLNVKSEIDTAVYPPGIKVSDSEMAALNITPHEFRGEWNYTIAPRPP